MESTELGDDLDITEKYPDNEESCKLFDEAIVVSQSDEEEGEIEDTIDVDAAEIEAPEKTSIAEEITNADPLPANSMNVDEVNTPAEQKEQLPPETIGQQDSIEDNEDDNIPLINIMFRNKASYQEFRTPFLKCIENVLVQMKNPNYNIIENSLDSSILLISKNSQTQLRENDNFMIDTTLTEVKSRKSIPLYNASSNLLNSETIKVGDDAARAKTDNNLKMKAMVCFNCDGNHNLVDCKERRNQRKISKAKNEHFKKGQRYHKDVEQKFGKFVPGRISNNLQRALGLGKYDLPNHIYKMKQFGYPPGWLEEAKISHSGLNLFDSKGLKVLESDEDEGEIEMIKDKYDARKIFEFPGYNVPDAYSGEISPHHTREALIQSLQGNLVEGYKRKKLKKLSADEDLPEKDINLEHADMSTESDSEEPGQVTFSDSVLEIIDEPVIIDITESPVCIRRKSAPNTEDSEERGQSQSPPPSQIIGSDPVDLSSPSPSIKHINTTEFGTPVIKSFSPYSKLPSGIEFSKGVSDVINFENLPDSTGNYEKKMKSIIDKVRTHVTKINSE